MYLFFLHSLALLERNSTFTIWLQNNLKIIQYIESKLYNTYFILY
jgi:hypothetical protein